MPAVGDSIVIAIDGPVAAGKGTIARKLAVELGFAYLDTGSLYRAVAAKLIADGEDPEKGDVATRYAAELVPQDLDRQDLRLEQVGQGASIVAANPGVRQALLALQRHFAEAPPDGKKGAVLDGRDIGTVICPEAPFKFFVTATAEARAKRRHKELLERGEESIYARVLQDLRERDARDSARANAPLKAALNAVQIDTTEMDIEAAYATVRKIVADRLAN